MLQCGELENLGGDKSELVGGHLKLHDGFEPGDLGRDLLQLVEREGDEVEVGVLDCFDPGSGDELQV